MNKKIRKKYKIQKPWNKQKIPGDHKLAFYRDNKSGHPYMRISEYGNYYYGHDLTSHPSLREDKRPRNGYIRFKRNPNPSSKERSYYHKSIRRLLSIDSYNFKRFSPRKGWNIYRRDMRKLKKIDYRKIKNIHK